MKDFFRSNSGSVIVNYDELNEIIIVHFFDEISHADYIFGCETMLNLLAEKNCSNVIFDNRELKMVSTQSKAWAVRAMLPKMYSPNLKVSIINAKNFSSKLAVDTMLEVAEQMGFKLDQIKAFHSLEEGVSFLVEERKG